MISLLTWKLRLKLSGYIASFVRLHWWSGSFESEVYMRVVGIIIMCEKGSIDG